MENIQKVMIVNILMIIAMSACTPEIRGEEWCKNLEEKPKADWTIREAKDYAKHCLLK
ncbi:DUF3012 domain-containing protein [Kaarinaea lacus]